MASSTVTATTGWYKGRVKAVPSGDCLVIVPLSTPKPGQTLPEKTITLSSLIAPRLARRGGVDESFAWESREFLRKLCIGKEVAFRVDYNVPSINRDFGSVFLGNQNVAMLVVSGGWAKGRYLSMYQSALETSSKRKRNREEVKLKNIIKKFPPVLTRQQPLVAFNVRDHFFKRKIL